MEKHSKPKSREQSLVLSSPNYGIGQSPRRPSSTSRGAKRISWEALPYARKEGDLVSRILGAKHFYGDAADETVLKAAKSPTFSMSHRTGTSGRKKAQTTRHLQRSFWQVQTTPIHHPKMQVMDISRLLNYHALICTALNWWCYPHAPPDKATYVPGKVSMAYNEH